MQEAIQINENAISKSMSYATVLRNINDNFQNINQNFEQVAENISNERAEITEIINKGGFVCGLFTTLSPDEQKKDIIYEYEVPLGFKPKFVVIINLQQYKHSYDSCLIKDDVFDTVYKDKPILTDNGFKVFEPRPNEVQYKGNYLYMASRYGEVNDDILCEMQERVATSEV